MLHTSLYVSFFLSMPSHLTQLLCWHAWLLSLPCHSSPTLFWCLRVVFASDTVADGFNFISVARVAATHLMNGSWDSVNIISRLSWAHLNSSTKLEIGRDGASSIQVYAKQLTEALLYLCAHQSLQPTSMG